jgi:hypothetical protein
MDELDTAVVAGGDASAAVSEAARNLRLLGADLSGKPRRTTGCALQSAGSASP